MESRFTNLALVVRCNHCGWLGEVRGLKHGHTAIPALPRDSFPWEYDVVSEDLCPACNSLDIEDIE